MASDLHLRGGAPVSLLALARQTRDMSPDALLAALRELRRHTKASMGLDPFAVGETSTGSVRVEAGPHVGVLSYGDLRVFIQPKIDGLSFEEALFLDHMGGRQTHLRHQHRVLERLLQRDERLESVDLLAVPFLDACLDVINNGLLTTHRVEAGVSSRLRGQLVLQKQLQLVGPFYPWYSEWHDASPDVPENQLLKLALTSCLQRLTSQSLRSVAAACYRFFGQVHLPRDFSDIALTRSNGLRRADYERVVELAELVVRGVDPRQGEHGSYLPTFLLNLDDVFEHLVTHQLSKLVREPCEVRSSFQETHGFAPEVSDRYIELDALFTRRRSETERRHIVIDAKNKYRGMSSAGAPLPPDNPDLFQTTFYASRLNALAVVVVYPTDRNATGFPLPGSQGEAAYRERVERRLIELEGQANRLSHPSGLELPIFTWRLKVTGGPRLVSHALAQLANFLIEYSDI